MSDVGDDTPTWRVALRMCVAAALACFLGHRGLKKQSLDKSGALAALFVGFFSLASGYRFGVLLLGFYFSGSKLTKVRANVKLQLDANYKVGGQRSAQQVLACSLLATGIAVYYMQHFGDRDAPIHFSKAPVQSFLLASYIGHYACCAADTWASELGVLSKSSPRLITTLRKVPPGTNGAVSGLGLAASALGGAFIGVLYFISSLFTSTAQPQVILLGTTMGLFGSVLDSILGATLQSTWFDKTTKKICAEGTRKPKKSAEAQEHVCGIDVLTNEQVNVVSVVVATIASGYIAQAIFS